MIENTTEIINNSKKITRTTEISGLKLPRLLLFSMFYYRLSPNFASSIKRNSANQLTSIPPEIIRKRSQLIN